MKGLCVVLIAAVLLAAIGLPVCAASVQAVYLPVEQVPSWLSWVVDNAEAIVQVVALIVALVLALMGRSGAVRRLAVEAMLEAEKLARRTLIGNEDRFVTAVVNLTDRMPADVKGYFKLVATLRGQSYEELIADLVQRWYDLALKEIQPTAL